MSICSMIFNANYNIVMIVYDYNLLIISIH